MAAIKPNETEQERQARLVRVKQQPSYRRPRIGRRAITYMLPPEEAAKASAVRRQERAARANAAPDAVVTPTWAEVRALLYHREGVLLSRERVYHIGLTAEHKLRAALADIASEYFG